MVLGKEGLGLLREKQGGSCYTGSSGSSALPEREVAMLDTILLAIIALGVLWHPARQLHRSVLRPRQRQRFWRDYAAWAQSVGR